MSDADRITFDHGAIGSGRVLALIAPETLSGWRWRDARFRAWS